MAFVLAILVVVAAVLVFGMNRTTTKTEQPDASLRTALAAQGLQVSDLLQTESLTLALDESKGRIAFASRAPNQAPVIQIVSYVALLAVSILRDDAPVVEVRRSDARAPVADPLRHVAIPTGLDTPLSPGRTSGVGLLVSGMSGTADMNVKLKLSRLALRVLTGDGGGGAGSEYFVRVLDLQRPDYLSTFWLRPQIAATEQWYRKLGGLIQQADGELAARAAVEPPSPAKASTFVADEIAKLADLMERRIITEAQFTQQRDRLLGDTESAQ
ncbi:MAG: SHOCT domain-containing protein [Gemmatimonadota bacterium]|nr:SHOCT domain-containing protein [Gemmatimonadota bacterium]